jgi:hypothetical protein
MATLKNTVIDDTAALQLPVGTTAQRPSPAVGMMRFNTLINTVEQWNGSRWSYTPDIVTNGLILRLDAAEPTSYSGSGTAWNDMVGTNHATLINGASYSPSNGGCIEFDGVDDYAAGNLPTTAVTNVTVTAFINVTLNTSGAFFKIGSTSPGWGAGIGDSTYTAATSIGNNCIMLFSGVRWIPSNQTWNSGWQMVTMVLDPSSTATLYKNDKFIFASSGSNPGAITGDYNIGRAIGDEPSGNRAALIKVANFMMYDRELTPSEIRQNFNAMRSRFGI